MTTIDTDMRLEGQGLQNLRQFVPKRTPELEQAVGNVKPKAKEKSQGNLATKIKTSFAPFIKPKEPKTEGLEKPAKVKPAKVKREKVKPAKIKREKVKPVKEKRAKLKPAKEKKIKRTPKRQTPKVAAERRKPTDRRRDNSSKNRNENLSFQSLNKYIRLSYLTLFLLVFVIGGWTFLAKIQGAVIASGQVAVEGKPKIVQHLDGGIVSHISVKEGDIVTKGQTVLKLDSTILNANLDAAQTNYFENQALISRLMAEKIGQERIFWSESLTRKNTSPRVRLAMNGQEQLFFARRNALQGEINQFTQRIEQLKDEDRGLISEIEFTRSELALVEQEFSKLSELLRQNLISRNRVTDLERDRTRLKNAVSKLDSRRAGIRNAIKESQIKISQVQRLRNEEVLTELRLAQTKADSYSEALKTVSSKSKLITIQAPASGVVHEMTVSTVGGVIAPGQEIMQIIPERDSLIISAQVMPGDLDQVTLGQETNVIFSTLKQSSAPELDGTVSYISADNLIDPITGSPYFIVEVEIADTQLPKLNGQSLVAGMPADIFIQTDKRTVLEYLLGPLKDTLKKTMRDG